MTRVCVLILFAALTGECVGQKAPDASDFNLVLPSHAGKLHWHADGFNVVELSAKSGEKEIGIRGKDASGRLNFLGFLFLVPEQAPMTSAKCRDGVMEPEKKSNSTLKITGTNEAQQANGPVVVTYSVQGKGGKMSYMTRGFIATNDICGDLEFYGDQPIAATDAAMAQIFATYALDRDYTPQFSDALLYAEILYRHEMYGAAAPVFERALTLLGDDSSLHAKTMRRVATDESGMSYGMSGNLAKSRSIFEAAVAKDPDYPLYYYNLACADAEEKKLADAESHLRQAFARKANVLSGETMPDPSKDDSFLRFRDNKEFWSFIEGLH